MSLNRDHVKLALRSFNFSDLFIDELGWDSVSYIQPIREEIDKEFFIFTPIAEKRGLVVFSCEVPNGFPPHPLRKKLDSRIAKTYREHFIIFFDRDKTRQLWQWVWRAPGRPLVSRTHEYQPEQNGESLIQKLETIAFSLEEEDTLNIVEVSGRLRAAFNVERATRRFYDYFKKERTSFENFISGIVNIETKREYVSVMLNRLMFIYFIQRKGFLDGDPDYLRNRMAMTRERHGYDHFYSFYRYFLLRLFHEAFGSLERNPEIEELIGDVPYLNGGIFEIHQIERDNSNIQIPDEAFERVLDFFDQYQWHLDDRTLRSDNEINPDLLGYIFEKYINQKQMGAYYTKEDITEYISKNTIIPYLFDAAQKIYPQAFQGDDSFWILLEADPRRYIFEAVQKGVDLPLPEEIAVGIDDVSKRGKWNTRTNEEYALPTEIWRETVARRQRYQEVRDKLKNGEITEINNLITYNLDILQFAQDVVETCDKPETLRAFWQAIQSVTILDPTCGSGAFLFAALNILHPLYEACLDRMQTFIDEYPKEAPVHALKDFKGTLTNVSRHPNEDYYILKSIIVDNLYGVDIMAEAVEIAKLRLFLKLAAQVEPDRYKENWGIEPLPDIDFNIRPGNTLVGFVSREELKKAFTEVRVGSSRQNKLFLLEDDNQIMQKIEEDADDVDRLYSLFRNMQIAYDMSTDIQDFSETKAKLQKKLDRLREKLSRALAHQYRIKPEDTKVYSRWVECHKPFHWFIEFYRIMQSGGFNVVIGNPPYLALRSLVGYTIKGFQTISTRNLYSTILEACQSLSYKEGRQGYIVPVSSISTAGYLPLQKILMTNLLFISSYDDRPSHLFSGLDKNTLSIVLISEYVQHPTIYSTRLCRWNSEERDHLFEILEYSFSPENKIRGSVPKLGSKIEAEIWGKIFSEPKKVGAFYRENGEVTYYSRKVNAFLQVLDFVPEVRDGKGNLRPPSEFKELKFRTEDGASAIFCCYNSTLFRWFIDIISDGSHVNRREVDNFPFDPEKAVRKFPALTNFANKLSEELKSTSEYRLMRYSHDTLTVQCIIPKFAKETIDNIDNILGQYYKLTDDELDFIINYDIKYRIGDELFNTKTED